MALSRKATRQRQLRKKVLAGLFRSAAFFWLQQVGLRKCNGTGKHSVLLHALLPSLAAAVNDIYRYEVDDVPKIFLESISCNV